MKNHRNFGLDCVRVVAIGLVLIAHFAKVYEFLGFWGVEIFFALSGYLIGGILYRYYDTEKGFSCPKIMNFW